MEEFMENKLIENKIVLYITEEGKICISVIFKDETLYFVPC